MPSVSIQVLPHGEGLPLPSYATAGAAGCDLLSAEEVTLQPMQRIAVATGVAIALPHGFEAQVRPRSGLALRHGITVANAPGTIDADYRGEIKVVLVNLGSGSYLVRRGDRIAQLVVAPVTQVSWEPVSQLPVTQRGGGGFGSTGR